MRLSPIEKVINFLTDDSCVICQATGVALCANCFYSTYEEIESRCYICNKLTISSSVCKSCRSSSRLRRVWWLDAYDGALKSLLYRIKYQRYRSGARVLGSYLAEVIPYLPPNTIVSAIPTATTRIRRRGFDQAVLMAQSLAETRKLPFRTLLKRHGQAELIGQSRTKRRAAMQSVYQPHQTTLLKGASVLLIDDVLTTGASLEAAAATLRTAGARHVDAAVIARHIKK